MQMVVLYDCRSKTEVAREIKCAATTSVQQTRTALLCYWGIQVPGQYKEFRAQNNELALVKNTAIVPAKACHAGEIATYRRQRWLVLAALPKPNASHLSCALLKTNVGLGNQARDTRSRRCCTRRTHNDDDPI